MFETFSRSWRLVKASWSVLRADKELIVFPIVSAIGTLIIIAIFAVPTIAVGIANNVADGNLTIVEYAVAFLFYLVMYTVVIFANTALVGAALIRLDGGDPTLRDGWNIALDHLPQILGYAAISATFGLIMRFLRERGGLAGMIASWVGEMAWNLATFLVVPVLVVEGVGPLEAIKRSTNYLKSTWGEQITGNFSMGLIFGLIGFGTAIGLGLLVAMAAFATGSVAVVVLGVLLIVVALMTVGLISSTLQGIYVAALYRYATAEVIDERFFSRDLIEDAFRPEKKKKRF